MGIACAATKPTLFSFHLSKTFSQSKSKTHLPFSNLQPKSISLPPLYVSSKPKFYVNSIDVTKEDKPVLEETLQEPPPSSSQDPTFDANEPESAESIDKRRLEEKFAVLNTGIYECRSCGYKYDESAGDPSYPIPPGMQFDKLPEDWRCPTCGAAQSFFQSKRVEIAGFAENQQYGLGGNTLTSGQKTALIYGTLLFFFILFLSGYFLQ